MSWWNKFRKKSADITSGTVVVFIVIGAVGLAVYCSPIVVPTYIAISAGVVEGALGVSMLTTSLTHLFAPGRNNPEEDGLLNNVDEEVEIGDAEGQTSEKRISLKSASIVIDAKNSSEKTVVSLKMFNSMKTDLEAFKQAYYEKQILEEERNLLDKSKLKKEMSEIKTDNIELKTRMDRLDSSIANSNAFFYSPTSTVASSPNAINDPSINEQPSRSNLRHRRALSKN